MSLTFARAHLRPLAFPAELRAEIAHGNRFARAVRVLRDGCGADDPAAIWLTGRSEEIEAFVDDVAREWIAGSIPAQTACDTIASYLSALHVAMEPWYGQWFAPSCCGPVADSQVVRSRVTLPHRRSSPRDTLSDAGPISHVSVKVAAAACVADLDAVTTEIEHAERVVHCSLSA